MDAQKILPLQTVSLADNEHDDESDDLNDELDDQDLTDDDEVDGDILEEEGSESY